MTKKMTWVIRNCTSDSIERQRILIIPHKRESTAHLPEFRTLSRLFAGDNAIKNETKYQVKSKPKEKRVLKNLPPYKICFT